MASWEPLQIISNSDRTGPRAVKSRYLPLDLQRVELAFSEVGTTTELGTIFVCTETVGDVEEHLNIAPQ